MVSALVVAWALSAATRHDLTQALAAAEALEAKRAWDAARRQLAGVAGELGGEAAEEPRLRICALWAREGEVMRARQCYATAKVASAEARARARYHAAALGVEAGDVAAGEELAALIDELPETLGARRALVLARGLASDAGGPGGEADFLLGVASRLAGKPHARALCAEAWLGAGRLHLEERGDAKGAERLLAHAQEAARETPWADDALYWHAEALARLGTHARALALYRGLIDARASSWFVGSYDSVFYDDALLAVGEMLEAMGRKREAERAYAALADKAPTSRFLDDAAFRRALLRFAAGARGALGEFVAHYPDSRHVRAARLLMAEP